jgi:ESS family glutamate:Na+ symporter
MSFCGLCLLLLLGKFLRIAMPFLQRLYLPASVIGGLVGLIWINTLGKNFAPDWFANWSQLPGFLINIVFATLFIGSRIPKVRSIWQLAAPQLCYGQLVAWGQYVVGLAAAGLLLVPLFGVNPAFGTLLEIGFEGGHGTVGGLSSTFEKLGWPDGRDLGYATATAGMILGITLGMALINFAVRRGYVSKIRTFADQDLSERRGIYPRDAQPPAGRQTVFSDSVDSLAFHIAVIGIAVLIGFGFKELLLKINVVAPEGIRNLRVLESFPLFPLCMIGGLILQKVLTAVKLEAMVDHGQVQRLGGAALDFLVVAAVASIRLDFVAASWLPLLILIATGTLWNVFCILFLAPRIFHRDWFERGIAEFGQSMGVTATGLLLLRTVDPQSETSAPQAFGYKQLLHEPIMGGGVWTSLALPLVISIGNWYVWLISAGAMVLWSLFYWLVIRPRNRREAAAFGMPSED